MSRSTYASESSGHWYTKEGEPCYEVPRKEGGMRPTTLRDARKLGLVPSVTTILKLLSHRGLEQWKYKQVMMSAITMPRLDGESDDDFCARILIESQEEGRRAASRGTALHTALEKAMEGYESSEWQDHVRAVFKALEQVNIKQRVEWFSERSFAHESGYGGRIDLSGNDLLNNYFVLDFKSKDCIDPKKTLAYDEHVMQLASYRQGIKLPEETRLLNVFVGVDDCQVVVHEWEQEEKEKALKKFNLLLRYWKLQNL